MKYGLSANTLALRLMIASFRADKAKGKQYWYLDEQNWKKKNKESWSTVVHSIHTIYPFLYVFVFSIKLYGCCVLYFYQPISQLLQLIACVGRAGYTVTMTISITIITNTITKIITITIYETSFRPSASSPSPSTYMRLHQHHHLCMIFFNSLTICLFVLVILTEIVVGCPIK